MPKHDESGVILPETAYIKNFVTKPVPAGLIANPFAHQFAHASQMGRMTIDGKDANPLSPFCGFKAPGPSDIMCGFLEAGVLQSNGERTIGTTQSAVAIVVLNSLERPLALVDYYEKTPGGYQFYYPALLDPDSIPDPDSVANLDPDSSKFGIERNRIPGACVYPHSSKRLADDGKPAMMGGIGMFGYLLQESPTPFTPGDVTGRAGGAWSFSYNQDYAGNFIGPHIGVACWTERHPMDSSGQRYGLEAVHTAVTVDVEGKFGTLAGFYQNCQENFHDESDDAKSITAWCRPEPMTDLMIGPVRTGFHLRAVPSVWPGATITLWVRDISSRLG